MAVKTNIRSLVGPGAAEYVRGEEAFVNRTLDFPVELSDFLSLNGVIKYVGVTERFRDVIDTFKTPEGETPAGFRPEMVVEAGGVLRVDLVRDISYDKNGIKRPTNLLFSADSANPYEVAPIKNLIANLTCNPGIIYDLFINNPKANVGGKYKTRDEVMIELARILGPGCDVSVELNNPFEESMSALLEEAAKFREIFSKYRVVIKVPHTGSVNAKNVNELLQGDKRLSAQFDAPTTEDALRGHNLALMMHENGYRVNFTLMFEPYQTQMALQARPYFINSFIRHRGKQTEAMNQLIGFYDATHDSSHIKAMRDFMLANDYLAPSNADMDLIDVLKKGRDIVKYRQLDNKEGFDGLDGIRHNLRVMRNCNMEDTRLIICSMEGDYNYPDIDKLLTEPEFQGMNDKVVITAEPNYLARFTSTNQVVSYQRRFMNAAQGMS
ncbi:MAG: transaldolase family protein [Christensenellales bacterium]